MVFGLGKSDKPKGEASKTDESKSKHVGPSSPLKIENRTGSEDNLWTALYDESGEFDPDTAPDTTDSNVRYAAYTSRVRTILLSAHRYVAYTSDIGESFRPVAHPWLVRGAYGISWLYIAGDVSYEGYKAWLRNKEVLNSEVSSSVPTKDQPKSLASAAASRESMASRAKVDPIEDYRTVMAQRAIFQSVASMGLPAFTIHSVVKYSGKVLTKAKNQKVRTYGPIGLGLSIVPFLPYIFDHPVEHAVEYTFRRGFEMLGKSGPSALKEKEL